jgi:hypothetical protein
MMAALFVYIFINFGDLTGTDGWRARHHPAGADPAGGADRPAAGAAPEIGRPAAVCPDGPEPERLT